MNEKMKELTKQECVDNLGGGRYVWTPISKTQGYWRFVAD